MLNATSSVAAGDYHVCFAEDGQTWKSIPSASSRFLTLRSLPSDSSHPRGPFHHQSASARAGKKADIGVAGFRMWTPNQASVAVVSGDDCYLGAGKGNWDNVIAVLAGDADSSSASEYRFKGDIPASAKGKYTLCMCDEDSWISARKEARPDGWASEGQHYYYGIYSWWEEHDGMGWNTTATGATFDPAYGVAESKYAAGGVTLANSANHKCHTKCSAGCIGASCFCDGLEDGDDTTDALCLSAALCRDMCNSEANCRGYSMHKEKSRCFLSSGVSTADNAMYDFWQSKWDGTSATAPMACRSIADYFALKTTGTSLNWQARMEVKKNLGSLFVTQKADVGVDYIATPGDRNSVEVTGSGLSFASDRVMVIDCFGTCGVKGSMYSSVSGPDWADSGAEAMDMTMVPPRTDFNRWVAVNARVDRPSLQELPKQAAAPTPTWKPFTSLPNQFCRRNLPPEMDSLAANHACYKKCYAEAPCTGDACFCDGFMSGFDNAQSRSLCLEQQQCEFLCAKTPGCHSVDMHKTKNRCFLNTNSCDDDVKNGKTVPDANYNLLVKPADDNTRRLMARGRDLSSSHVRQLLAAEDPGISWDQILRFKGLQFSSGGEFKLCFCDSDLLTGANEICNGPEDYTIEVGTVHATGLQCLLSNPKMTRGTCKSQEYGGLRCYDGAVPEVTVPAEFMGVPNPDGTSWTAQTKMLMGFCQFAPLHQTMEFAFCDQWRDDDGTGSSGGTASP